jgi:hypothetical protein
MAALAGGARNQYLQAVLLVAFELCGDKMPVRQPLEVILISGSGYRRRNSSKMLEAGDARPISPGSS